MKYTIALAGVPNSGKTTIFNELCGTHEKIGNWTGTTVEKKIGLLKTKNPTIEIVDLPGIYSLSTYSIDEEIAKNYLLNNKLDAVVCILNSANIERNIYLLIQLLELEQNTILVLNMSDIAEKEGIKIDIEKLKQKLQINIITTIASKHIDIDKFKHIILNTINTKNKNKFKIDYEELNQSIDQIEKILQKFDNNSNQSNRLIAIKYLEEDLQTINMLKNKQFFSELEQIKIKADQLINQKYEEDLESFIINQRYKYIEKNIKKHITNNKKKEYTISDKIDSIVTNKYLGIPIFFILMYLLFQTIFTIGDPIADLIDNIFNIIAEKIFIFLQSQNISTVINSLITEGIISGIASILVFLPNILLLYLGISIMEDSGYLSKAAFVMDRFMNKLGLHGKSFIPLLLGFGCNIPAIMAARTLESQKDRIITILVTPFISCSARLPVYILFAGVFFPKHAGLIVFSLYVIGIIIAIGVAQILNKTLFKKETNIFIMELPRYHFPVIKHLTHTVWIRTFFFIKKAGTIILLSIITIWLLSTFPLNAEYASKESLIGKIGQFIAPILKPAGFGEWQSAVALTFGIIAKEVVVSTLGTLYGASEAGLQSELLKHFNPISAYSFLLMTLIYIPCVATIATIKKETNWRWATFSLFLNLILGWITSVIFYQSASNLL